MALHRTLIRTHSHDNVAFNRRIRIRDDAETRSKSDALLTKLRDGDLRLADLRQDVRGRAVIDQSGKTVGHVKSLFIDEAERKVRVLDIGGGGFLGMGDQHFLLRVDAITSIRDNEVHVNETADRIKHSPAYDPTLVVNYDRDY